MKDNLLSLFCYVGILCSCITTEVVAEIKFDGVWPHREMTFGKIVERILSPFLPYNPVIVELKEQVEEDSLLLAKRFPKGHIMIFEWGLEDGYQPRINPASFNNLSVFSVMRDSRGDTQSMDSGWIIDVQRVLDSWKKNNNLDRIDLITLDGKRADLQFLRSSSDVVKTASVVFAKTNFDARRKDRVYFIELNRCLEEMGFCLLSHWYEEGAQGEAIFINGKIYDAVFR